MVGRGSPSYHPSQQRWRKPQCGVPTNRRCSEGIPRISTAHYLRQLPGPQLQGAGSEFCARGGDLVVIRQRIFRTVATDLHQVGGITARAAGGRAPEPMPTTRASRPRGRGQAGPPCPPPRPPLAPLPPSAAQPQALVFSLFRDRAKSGGPPPRGVPRVELSRNPTGKSGWIFVSKSS